MEEILNLITLNEIKKIHSFEKFSKAVRNHAHFSLGVNTAVDFGVTGASGSTKEAYRISSEIY